MEDLGIEEMDVGAVRYGRRAYMMGWCVEGDRGRHRYVESGVDNAERGTSRLREGEKRDRCTLSLRS